MSFSPSRLAALRKRTIWTLVAGVAIGSTGHIAAVTVGTIVAEQIAGTAALAGLPAASVVLGSAIGSALLSLLMARTGRRRVGLSAGYVISVCGAIVAASDPDAEYEEMLLKARAVLAAVGGTLVPDRELAAVRE